MKKAAQMFAASKGWIRFIEIYLNILVECRIFLIILKKLLFILFPGKLIALKCAGQQKNQCPSSSSSSTEVCVFNLLKPRNCVKLKIQVCTVQYWVQTVRKSIQRALAFAASTSSVFREVDWTHGTHISVHEEHMAHISLYMRNTWHTYLCKWGTHGTHISVHEEHMAHISLYMRNTYLCTWGTHGTHISVHEEHTNVYRWKYRALLSLDRGSLEIMLIVRFKWLF